MSTTLFAVGHGTLTSERFVAILQAAGIQHLVDVRTIPKSAHNPQFAREALAASLTAAGIDYRWEPRLGGLRRKPPGESPDVALRHPGFRNYAAHMRTPEFVAAGDELLALAASAPTAVMCSESVWWRCHRRMIADYVTLLRGATVLHLMHDGKVRPHAVTEGARIANDSLVYDAGGQLRLDAVAAPDGAP